MTAVDQPLDDGLLEALAEAAKTMPGVRDAAAVVRWSVRAPESAQPGAEPSARDAEDEESLPSELPSEPPLALPPADLDGGELVLPADAPATLQEGLRRAAQTAPGKGTVYITRGRDDDLQTYAELLAEAEHVLGGLRAAGLRPGDAALFVFDDNRAYLTAFWACVLGGFLPTPVAVALSYTTANEANRKLFGAWKLLSCPVLLTDTATVEALSGVRELWDEPDVRILTVDELSRHPADHDWYPARPDSPVLNLLTSGSTGVPKCVQHTNASVVSRTYAVIQHCGLTSDDVSLIWMPFDHVTVAFYNVRDVFLGCLHVNAKTNHFLADPLLWLEWAHRYRATNTWAPNFAFALVNEQAEEIGRRDWDLSSLREIVNAGEPVIAPTSHRFMELLAPHGLPADSVVPVWGMSETCSGVTYTRQSRDDHAAGTVVLDPASLSRNVRIVDPADRDAVTLSRVGRPIPGVRVRVVDEAGAVLSERRLGELRITGATIMAGYFGNFQANREGYDDEGWFRTGDLAFVHEGELVIAGRKKDQIIVRGINYMAHELESVVERVDGVRVSFSAAVGVRDPGAESDLLLVFFVPKDPDSDAVALTTRQIRAVLVHEAGIAPDLVIPVAEAEFPKTGSGKIQRAALVADFRAGRFADRLAEAAEPDADAYPATEQAGRSATWFATRAWEKAPSSAAMALPDGSRAPGLHLILAAEDDLAGLGIALGVDAEWVVATRGPRYARESRNRYQTAATDRAEISSLLTAVTAEHGPIDSIVCALPLSLHGEPAGRLTQATAELSALFGALADGQYGEAQLLILTAGAFSVDADDHVDLGTCALPSLVRTAAVEAAPLPVRLLDLPAADRSGWPAALDLELSQRAHTGLFVSRAGQRLAPKLTPVAADDVAGLAPQDLTVGGFYLVTGGLGGIALEIAAYLVAGLDARLLLVGRAPAAEGEKADRLAELTALGQVVYEQADVADADALEAAVRRGEERWGRPLDGVLHLAAADPTGVLADVEQHKVARESAAGYADQYHAKVRGTLAIAEVLENRPDATLVLFGSVNGEFAGRGFGAYAAASGFLAGFADHWQRERGRRVRCLAWTQWATAGVNRGRSSAAAEHRGFRTIADPETGLRLFLEALSLPTEQPYLVIGLDVGHPEIVGHLTREEMRAIEVVVACVGEGIDQADLRRRLREVAVDRGLPPLRILPELPEIPRDVYGVVDAAQLLRQAAATAGHGGRRFDAPAAGLETSLAVIWAEALHRDRIGRTDSFFELGGNSLRAARLLALVEQRLDGGGIRVSTQELYENPTVAGMSAVIEKYQTGVAAR